MRHFFSLFLFFMGTISMAQQLPDMPVSRIIPQPQKSEDYFNRIKIDKSDISLLAPKEFEHETQYFMEALKAQFQAKATQKETIGSGFTVLIEKIEAPGTLSNSTARESYHTIKISDKQALVKAASPQGAFYALQSILQLIEHVDANILQISSCYIEDYGQFAWRGMHLDVSRHFFSKDFVKKYIDMLAFYKMNVFHWHLTDDQGWRIEIKKYPKLTEVGAWRKGSMIGHYNEQRFDNEKHGGFYTQEEIKEVVAYAAQRHVTVVPEIEMPGHSLAAIAAYPELSCNKSIVEVGKRWGVETEVFCPTEYTFTFLENVLTEVIDLFPSQYIHIGGDEVLKDVWKSSTFCQELIKKEGLKDEHELQSYFIKRIERFVNSKGRSIIGWDEILEGGLAPNAAVMSWRGTEGGIAAAKEKHYVVMSPGTHCYFDHYQSAPSSEPLAIGGYTTLEKVYSFNPVPEALTSEERKYILGAQGNVWSEYMYTEANVEYMVFPRLLALAEVLWTLPENRKEGFGNFSDRVFKHFDILAQKNIQYSKSMLDVNYSIGWKNNALELRLSPCKPGAIVKYEFTSKDGKTRQNSTLYEQEIPITKSGIYSFYSEVLWYSNGLNVSTAGKKMALTVRLSKATGRPVAYDKEPSVYYPDKGNFTLVNGLCGDPKRYQNDWVAWSGENIGFQVDLGKIDKVSSVECRFLENLASWIYLPKQMKVLASIDGKNFREVTSKLVISKDKDGATRYSASFKATKAYYIKVAIENPGLIPKGNPGEGKNSWVFIDEVFID